MPTSRHGPAAVIVAITLLVLPGCDRLQDIIEERVQEEVAKAKRPPPPDPEPARAGEPEELLQQKLDLYVVCIGRSKREIAEAWERYAEDIDVKTGTPLRRNTAPYVRRIDAELRPCREAARRGPDRPPALPDIEEALTAYLQAAEAFAATTHELNAYYDSRGYQGDGWAKGKALAAPLAASYAGWEAAALRLEDLVDHKQDEADVEMLSLVERRSGRGLDYLSRAFVIAAKTFFRCTAAQQAEPSCDEELEVLSEAHAAFATHVEEHAEDARGVFWMESFESAVSDFMAAATRWAAATPKGRRFGEESERVESDYRELVQAANNLRFDFPRGSTVTPPPPAPRR